MESRIVEATTPGEAAAVKGLFQEYARSLDFDLCFQDFAGEMDRFPAAYAAPAGALLLARVEREPAGAVGLRPLAGEPGGCEMKRLYVRPRYRGLGLGRGLAATVLDAASARGYRVMRLDTIATMAAARSIYAELGFEPGTPYYDNPVEGVVYYCRELADLHAPGDAGRRRP